MSYCRWSSDDYQCDVYVYDSVGDFVAIHVAGNRTAPIQPPLPHVGRWWERGEEGMAAFSEREQRLMAWLETAPRLPIGLPHDGESFEMEDAAAAADKLEYLRGLGYNVPQYAIDALREEAAAESAASGASTPPLPL